MRHAYILLAGSILAAAHAASPPTCNATYCTKPDGAMTFSPVNDLRVVAICKDGMQWRAHIKSGNGHQGACSHHHGVASWTDGTPVRARSVNGRH